MSIVPYILKPLSNAPTNPWAMQPGNFIRMGVYGIIIFLIPVGFSVYNIYQDIPFLIGSSVTIGKFGGITGQNFFPGLRGGGYMNFHGVYNYTVNDTAYTHQVSDQIVTGSTTSYNPRTDGKPDFPQVTYIVYKTTNPADSRTISQSSPLADAETGLAVGAGAGALLYCTLYALAHSLMARKNKLSKA